MYSVHICDVSDIFNTLPQNELMSIWPLRMEFITLPFRNWPWRSFDISYTNFSHSYKHFAKLHISHFTFPTIIYGCGELYAESAVVNFAFEALKISPFHIKLGWHLQLKRAVGCSSAFCQRLVVLYVCIHSFHWNVWAFFVVAFLPSYFAPPFHAQYMRCSYERYGNISLIL